MLSKNVEMKKPSQRQMALTLLLVWAGWFTVNLAANGIFFIAAQGNPAMRLPGELLYFAGVTIMGILIPYHLCRSWNLDLPLLPARRKAGFWLGSVLFLILAIFLGIQAMADQGMTLDQLFDQPLLHFLAPLPVFIPTMIAYTILWYGLMLRGWQKVFGGGRWATVLAILLSAFLYGLYHFSSVDEILTWQGMLDEIAITSLIGIGFGVFVVLSRSLLVAFLINWGLNFFVFSPLETFHPPLWQWPLGVTVFVMLWLLYRFLWLEQPAKP